MQRIDLDQTRLPNMLGHQIRTDAASAIVSREIDAGPDVAVLPVLDAQTIQHVCGVEAGIVTELTRDDLESLCEGFDDGLLLVGDVAVGELVQVGADFHFAGASAGDDALVLDTALDDHDGVVEGALDFGNELLGATAEDQGAGFCCWAAREEVVALGADLDLFKGRAGAEVGGLDVGAGGLDGSSCGGADTVKVG